MASKIHRNGDSSDFSRLMFHTKCFSLLDLAVKALFFLYFPSPIAFLVCFLLAIPSVSALFGVRCAKSIEENGEGNVIKMRLHFVPAILHHFFFYAVPSFLFLAICIYVLFAGKTFPGMDNTTNNDPQSACQISFEYGYGSQLQLKTVCRFTEEFDPFCSKGCPPPDFSACRAMPEQLTIGNGFNGVKMSVNHWKCSWEKKFNGYQQMLTFVLGSAAIFAFFLFYLVQMHRLCRFFKTDADYALQATIGDFLCKVGVGNNEECQKPPII